MYPAQIVIPMKEELTENGFEELLTPEEVDNTLSKKGTTLVVVNSVCGCSAGSARPGVLMSVTNAAKRPDHLTTTFAGFDIDAVALVKPLGDFLVWTLNRTLLFALLFELLRIWEILGENSSDGFLQ